MECAHEIIITVKVVLLVVTEGHLAATVLEEEHSLTLLHGTWTELAIIQGFAWANSNNNTEVELFLLGLRQEDATLGLCEGFGPLDKDAVHEGTQLLEYDHLLRLFSKANKINYSL